MCRHTIPTALSVLRTVSLVLGAHRTGRVQTANGVLAVTKTAILGSGQCTGAHSFKWTDRAEAASG